jgi:serine/threonine-protein kinase
MLQKSAERRPSTVDDIIQPFGSFIKKIENDAVAVFIQNPNQYQETSFASEPVQAEPPEPVKTEKSHRGKIIWLSISIIGFLTIILIVFKIIVPEKQNDHNEYLVPDQNANKDSVKYSEKVTAQSLTNIDSVKRERMEKPSSKWNEQNQLSDQSELFKNSTEIKTEERTAKLFRITINTDPRAWLIINDDTVGITPVSYPIESVPTTLNTKINNPGFPEIAKRIEITEPMNQELDISLWEEVGYLKVTVNPWGQIWIDGDSIDMTPRPHPIILSSGSHVLEIKHPATKSILESIYIAPGDTLAKSYRLNQMR